MKIFDFLKKKDIKINIKTTPKKLKNLPSYIGYINSIKTHTTKGWYVVSMGKTKDKTEKKFYVDETGLHNITTIVSNKLIGTKLKVLLGEDLSSKNKENRIIMGWQFVGT